MKLYVKTKTNKISYVASSIANDDSNKEKKSDNTETKLKMDLFNLNMDKNLNKSQ